MGNATVCCGKNKPGRKPLEHQSPPKDTQGTNLTAALQTATIEDNRTNQEESITSPQPTSPHPLPIR